MGCRSIFLAVLAACAVTLSIGLTAQADPIVNSSGRSPSSGLFAEQRGRFTFDHLDSLGGKSDAWWDVQSPRPKVKGNSRSSNGRVNSTNGVRGGRGSSVADDVVLPDPVFRGRERRNDPYSVRGRADWSRRFSHRSSNYHPDDIDVPGGTPEAPSTSTPAPGATGLGLIGLALIALRRRREPVPQ